MLLSRLSPAPCTKLLIGSYARIEQLIVQWSHMSGSHFLHKPNISISGNAAKVDCLLLCDACEKWQLWLASQPDFSCWWHHVEVCPLHHHLLPLFRLIIILDLLPCFSPHSSLSSPFFILFFFLLTSPSLHLPFDVPLHFILLHLLFHSFSVLSHNHPNSKLQNMFQKNEVYPCHL